MIYSNFYDFSLNFYNYIYIFFNYELLVLISFFFFLIFILLSEKGQLSNYLYNISNEQYIKNNKILSQRLLTINELLLYLNKCDIEIKKIKIIYEIMSNDVILNLQYIIKKLLINLINLKIYNYLNIIKLRTQYLLFQINIYLTHDLFINKSWKLKNIKNNKINKYWIVLK